MDNLTRVTVGIQRVGKSVELAFVDLNQAMLKARDAAEEFKVACYPHVPSENDPIIKRMQEVADLEGKRLVLVDYPTFIGVDIFSKAFIVYDELDDLVLFRNRRHVVMWRGKKMVYKHELHLS